MNNPSKTIRSTLLVLGLLTSGCRVLSIPTYPLDAPSVYAAGDGCCGETGGDFSYAGVTGDGQAYVDGCPADWLSPLPQRHSVAWPVPKRWADWKARRDLPEPPAYPRFHSLPTRPMFQPQTPPSEPFWNGGQAAPTYGGLPDFLQRPDLQRPDLHKANAWPPPTPASENRILE